MFLPGLPTVSLPCTPLTHPLYSPHSALDTLASAPAAEIQPARFCMAPVHVALPVVCVSDSMPSPQQPFLTSSPKAAPPLSLPLCLCVPGTQHYLTDLFMSCLHLFPSAGTCPMWAGPMLLCSPSLSSTQNGTWHTPHPTRLLLSPGVGTTTRGAAGSCYAKGKMTPALPLLSPEPRAGKEGCEHLC